MPEDGEDDQGNPQPDRHKEVEARPKSLVESKRLLPQRFNFRIRVRSKG
jgi:hypothetical protein